MSSPKGDAYRVSVAIAFILHSPFRSSPLSIILLDDLPHTPSERLNRLLLAYLRLVTADSKMPSRYDWSNAPLHILRTQHPDMGVRLLAIHVAAVQRGWSELQRMEMEREWVGNVDDVDAPVGYEMEVVRQEVGGFQLRTKMVDGWLIPIFEAERISSCELFRQVHHRLAADDQCKQRPHIYRSIPAFANSLGLICAHGLLSLRTRYCSAAPYLPQHPLTILSMSQLRPPNLHFDISLLISS